MIAATLLTRLVALNHQRAAVEKRGLIRWLRPEYQNPTAPDAESLSAHFGRKNKKRTAQIEGILETLKGLGQL